MVDADKADTGIPARMALSGWLSNRFAGPNDPFVSLLTFTR